jgi:vancomycin permeability regulator SanA
MIWNNRLLQGLLRLLAGLTGIVLVGGLGLVFYVGEATRSRRFVTPGDVPSVRVAIVFGAGVRGERPTRILAERIDAAVALYQAGRVQKLLMTGDNSRNDYDEVTAMRRYAVTQGVDPADITLDYAGFSTYESCYRARVIFGVEQATLVTQAYHLPRAVYTCRHLGISATGLAVRDWGAYPDALIASYALREIPATLKALADVHLLRPTPTFLGPFEGIN